MESSAPVAAAGDVTVRRVLRPGDPEAIVDLHRRIYPGEHGVDETFTRDVGAELARLVARGWPGPGEGIWVVERNGALAGCLALSDEGQGTGRVRFFLLEPGLRGDGLGRRLLGELLERARGAGHSRLTLTTFEELRAAAHLYRQAGFRVVAEDRSPRWGRERFCLQHYELALGSPEG